MRKKQSRSELIISSKVTLLRNIEDFLFTPMLDFENSEVIADEVAELFSTKKNFKIVDIDIESESYLNLLKAHHLINEEYTKSMLRKKVIIRNDMRLCIVINNKNHIEITSIHEDEDLESAYEECNKVSRLLEENFKIAFSDKYGYLTTNISNLGIGMKTSFLVHIPLLELSSQISNLNLLVAKVGYAMKPIYNIDNNASGGLYVINATNTFSTTEEECFRNLKAITYQMLEREEILRNEMLVKERERIIDEVSRAYGILTNARLISEKEAVILLSYLRIGTQLNLFENKNLEDKDPLEILHNSMNGILNYKTKRKMTELEKDIKRANYIKEKLLI